ncbi:MAG: hypothetical protein ABI880_03920 [Acidobacteriota bacterium]
MDDYLVRGDITGPDVMTTDEPNHQRGFAMLKHAASISTSTHGTATRRL